MRVPLAPLRLPPCPQLPGQSPCNSCALRCRLGIVDRPRPPSIMSLMYVVFSPISPPCPFSLFSLSLSFLSRKRACSRASLPFQFLLCLRSVFVVVVLRFSAFFPSLSPTVFARRMSSNRLKLKLLLSRSNVAHRRGMILISLINRYPSGEYSNLKSFDFFSLRFSFFFLSLSVLKEKRIGLARKVSRRNCEFHGRKWNISSFLQPVWKCLN